LVGDTDVIHNRLEQAWGDENNRRDPASRKGLPVRAVERLELESIRRITLPGYADFVHIDLDTYIYHAI
jgi:hypothetical protein